MTDLEQKKAAKEFSIRWKDRGYEKGESQQFWLGLLRDVLCVKNVDEYIRFEESVHIDETSGFIDGFIDSTKVLIEQKSIERDLRKAIRQSDGSLLTPYQQARKYANELPYDQRPRWIITCNFKSFLIYDMNNPNGEPEELLLKDLGKEYYRLSFLVDSKNEHIRKEVDLSFKAGEIVGLLYESLSKQYNDLSKKESQKSLNELCVRLVFCLYAEDAGIFGKRNIFHDYLSKQQSLDSMRSALINLFKILDTPDDKRDPYLEDDLNQFPYVNGGLFSNEEIEIPKFTEEIRITLLEKASEEFDWSEISPTIFGAVFESTLNPMTRREGGMHYTSIENIHKVIDPLFLDDLREELNKALAYKNAKTRNKALLEFQKHIGSLNFLDPACGSGNFLTETYLSLRRMENEAILAQQDGESTGALYLDDVIKVNINQFYGIEINDFAVKVATTALWIAESQMLKETEEILKKELQFLPLKSYENIYEGNALRKDWNDVIQNDKCNYIIGNPPFIGYKLQTINQKEDLIQYFEDIKNVDYVSGWYYKAAEYIFNKNIRCAFVSTNSICQGEQVSAMWKLLFKKFDVEINFAYRTFIWNSEATIKAAVHCVIVGFSHKKYAIKDKLLFDGDRYSVVNNINAYLVNFKNIIIEKSSKSICGAESMLYGSEPREGGFLLLSEEESMELLNKSPYAKKYIKRFVSSDDFINNKIRYCLWIEEDDLNEIRKSDFIMERLKKCSEFRKMSKQKQAHDAANTPYKFASVRQPKNDYLLIPVVSSQNRKYIPIGYCSKDIIVSNACFTIPNASRYTFGILTSNVHMAWLKAVCGRLKSDFRYSNTLVYNNFPWPNSTREQKEKIEKTAQAILDARAKYPNSSLADLYDELTMPVELRKAHQQNDIAVMEAYGFDWKHMTESDCVAKLMQMYQELTKKDN